MGFREQELDPRPATPPLPFQSQTYKNPKKKKEKKNENEGGGVKATGDKKPPRTQAIPGRANLCATWHSGMRNRSGNHNPTLQLILLSLQEISKLVVGCTANCLRGGGTSRPGNNFAAPLLS